MTKLARGASRLTRIANWLRATPPASVTTLQLQLVSTDTPSILWQHERAEGDDHEELARAIDVALQDCAEELCAKIEAKLSWIAGEREWTSTHFKAQPSDGAANDFDGSPRNMLIQEQRHKEVRMRLEAEVIQTTLDTLRQDNASMRKVLDQRDNRTERVENENARLREELSTARAELTEAQSIAEDLAEKLEEALRTIGELKTNANSDAEVIKLAGRAITGQLTKGETK